MNNTNNQNLILNLNSFLERFEVRYHTDALCKNVYVSQSKYHSVIIEFELNDPAAIKEFGETYNLYLPSIDEALQKPYSYVRLFKSIALDLTSDSEGNIDLAQLKGRRYMLSIEKFQYNQGNIAPRVVNLIDLY